jgi:hypothetical protein
MEKPRQRMAQGQNKGAHGLDRVTLDMFEADLEKNLRAIQRKLMERRYTPTPIRRVYAVCREVKHGQSIPYPRQRRSALVRPCRDL